MDRTRRTPLVCKFTHPRNDHVISEANDVAAEVGERLLLARARIVSASAAARARRL